MECKIVKAEDVVRIENRNMQQTIDQLRANAKCHKKTVDKLSAKVSQLTQALTEANQHIAKLESKTDMNYVPAKKKEQSELSKAFCYVVMVFSSGWLLAMGAALALFSLVVIGN